MKYIPATISLIASFVLLLPDFTTVWFWLSWMAICFVLIITMMDEDDRRSFLNEKSRSNGINR